MKEIIEKIINKIKYQKVLIFIGVLLAFFLIDWLTKYFLFDTDAANVASYIPIEKDYGLFGIRSLAHGNTTLFSFLKINTSAALRSTLNFILIIIFISWAIFSTTTLQAVALGIVTGGMMGNALDVVFTSGTLVSNYVRDILYLPWLDRGTFNFADLFIISGCILLFINVLINLWFEPHHEKEPKIQNEMKK